MNTYVQLVVLQPYTVSLCHERHIQMHRQCRANDAGARAIRKHAAKHGVAAQSLYHSGQRQRQRLAVRIRERGCHHRGDVRYARGYSLRLENLRARMNPVHFGLRDRKRQRCGP